MGEVNASHDAPYDALKTHCIVCCMMHPTTHLAASYDALYAELHASHDASYVELYSVLYDA